MPAYGRRSCVSDPLVHHGRHFGRNVHALCNVYALITNGLLRDGERSDEPEDSFTAEYVFYFSGFCILGRTLSFTGKDVNIGCIDHFLIWCRA